MTSRLRRGDNAGFTLVELLVIMVIVGVVGAITVAGVTRGMRTASQVEGRVETLAQVQVVMERISREIRASDPVREVTDDRLVLDVCRGGELQHYRYQVQPAGNHWELIQTRWDFQRACPDPDWQPTEADAAQTSTRALVDRLTSDAVFTALDDAGVALDGTAEGDAEKARRVRMRVRRAVPDGQDTIEAETAVTLRNR